MSRTSKLRGLAALLRDVLEHGSRAAERLQLDSAARPFALLEAMPTLAGAATIGQAVHDGAVTAMHGILRGAATIVHATAEIVLDVIEPGDHDN